MTERVDLYKNRVQKIPVDISGVYFLFKGEECVYIGESNSIFRRSSQHMNHKKNEWDSFKIHPVEGEHKRKALESFLINVFQPKLNKVFDCPMTATAISHSLKKNDPYIACVDYFAGNGSYGVDGNCEKCCCREFAGSFLAAVIEDAYETRGHAIPVGLLPLTDEERMLIKLYQSASDETKRKMRERLGMEKQNE